MSRFVLPPMTVKPLIYRPPLRDLLSIALIGGFIFVVAVLAIGLLS